MASKGERSASTPLILSSSAAVVSEENKEETIAELKEMDQELKQSEGDDGYCTPTSPRHRIPAPLECPRAPKKPSSLRRTKRKKRSKQDRGLVNEGGFGDNYLSLEQQGFSPAGKKARNKLTFPSDAMS
ncbi:hypothetical protein Cni_G13506 [Canna indica]|uniref:Uncharacterized protein n=1 Tax=Canna indica TaxID=4628 RepID=A0AAQ3QBK5_9LILI|nr:hypothetical protein Cni_G13506 [Canna indica]